MPTSDEILAKLTTYVIITHESQKACERQSLALMGILDISIEFFEPYYESEIYKIHETLIHFMSTFIYKILPLGGWVKLFFKWYLNFLPPPYLFRLPYKIFGTFLPNNHPPV